MALFNTGIFDTRKTWAASNMTNMATYVATSCTHSVQCSDDEADSDSR